MRKIVWICSIYPTSHDPFLGDFIKRHFEAASMHCDITVVHVCSNYNASAFEQSESPDLKVHLINVPQQVSANYLQRQYHFINAYMSWFANYIKANGKPELVHVHNSVHGAFIGWLVKKRYGIPYLLTEHSSVFLPESALWKKSSTVLRLTTKSGISGASGLSTVSDALSAGMKKLVHRPASAIIPNAIDTSLFYYEPVSHRPAHFIHNTGPEHIKNTFRVLKAISMIKDQLRKEGFKLIVFGIYRADIDSKAASLEISDMVEQKGEVPQSLLAGHMRRAAALIQHSSYETFGCIVAEALAAGCPVIASEIPAMSELINVNNGICSQLDAISLSKALKTMARTYLQYNREEIAEQTKRRFSYAAVGEQFNQWYKTFGL
ncbi:MAG TPA: glycosyltransferase [Flavitalea sp.]|nr:glycosyltransferase [Flavitalea sp.]